MPATATDPIEGFSLSVVERVAIVQALLAENSSCAIAVFDPARNMTDARSALDAVGVAADGHSFLRAGAMIEFLSVASVQPMSDAAAEASLLGSATRRVVLRDGSAADLHMIEIGDTEQATVAVLVPGTDATIAPTPAPTAMAASPRIGVVRCNAFGAVTSASPSTLELMGRPTKPLEGTTVLDVLHPDDQQMAIINWLAAKEQRGVALRWRCRLVRADLTTLWVEATITNSIDADGSGDVHISLNDISREVAATEALIAERELIALVTETLPVGVAKFGVDGSLEHANRRLGELLAPLDPSRLVEQAVHGTLGNSELAVAFAALLTGATSSRLVVDHVGPEGVPRHLEWTIRAALDAGGVVTGGVLCIADVTEAAQLRSALENRARTDALTNCLNRAGTIAALDHALTDDVGSAGIGLLFIDLDGFKAINDARGHAVGDAVLEVVAERLRRSVRPGDLVGRLGGDEFVVIAPGLTSAVGASALARRVNEQLEGPATIDGERVAIAASIGVAWTASATGRELLAAADAAMYVAKHAQSQAPVVADGLNAPLRAG